MKSIKSFIILVSLFIILLLVPVFASADSCLLFTDCSDCAGNVCAGSHAKIISYEPENCGCNDNYFAHDCGADYKLCQEESGGPCYCSTCRTAGGPCNVDGDCCPGLGLTCVWKNPTEKICRAFDSCADKADPDAYCRNANPGTNLDYCIWDADDKVFECRECKQDNQCGACEVCNDDFWCVNDPGCCETPGDTKACSCSYNYCFWFDDCRSNTLNGIKTCLETNRWGPCSVTCPANACSVDANCVGYDCHRLVSTAASNSNLFVTDAADTAKCFNDECVYNGAIYESSVNVDTWEYTAHPNPHFGVAGDTNINIVCSAWGANDAHWANPDYVRTWCLGVGGEWDVDAGDANAEPDYFTDIRGDDPLYCDNARSDWTGTPSLDCCCGDDTGETYRYFMTSGGAGPLPDAEPCNDVTDENCVNGGRDTTDFACCNAADDCVYNGACYAKAAFRDLNGDGRIDGWCMTAPAYAGNWRDCDGDAATCNGGCGSSWFTGGEIAPFGEYDTGISTECCGDDTGEYAITTNILGVDHSACCNAVTDCVDETGTCRDGTEICDNGLDDDCDGFADAADTDCPEGALPPWFNDKRSWPPYPLKGIMLAGLSQ